MYVRDHARPELYKAFGMDPTEYDHQVLDITSEISKQVFPFTLDLHHPRFRAGLERLSRLMKSSAAAKQAGGILSVFKRAALMSAVGVEFVRLYLLPTRPNELPQDVRLSPAW
jgi:magnesium-protoporphyrin IX monomethyl ester (oxidative) cyclase